MNKNKQQVYENPITQEQWIILEETPVFIHEGNPFVKVKSVETGREFVMNKSALRKVKNK